MAAAANTDADGTITVTVLPAPGTTPGNESEYFIVSFAGTGMLNLQGWTVSDTLASVVLRHAFGSVTLTNGQSYKVCGNTALGTDCDATVNSGGNTIWNNTGDTLQLKDELNETVLNVTWGAATSDTEYSNFVAVDYAPSPVPTLLITAPAYDNDYISGDSQGNYVFTAEYANITLIDEFYQWKIYEGICDSSNAAIFGNVDTRNDSSNFSNNIFTASVNISSLAPGNYCFYVDPTDDDDPDLRKGREFSIYGYNLPSDYIEGYKWNDRNGNGMWDKDEEGLAGWTIVLTHGEDTFSTVTNENGHYSYDVTPGTWIVSEVAQTGWQQTGLIDSSAQDQAFNPSKTTCEFNVGLVTLPDVEVTFSAFAIDNYQVFDEQYDFQPSEVTTPYICDFGNQQVESEEEITVERSSGKTSGTRLGERPAPAGQVLGATTSGKVAPTCGRYLFDYMRAGMVTYAKEVIKLQTFLSGQGLYTPTTGIFDDTTTANVRLFQAKHMSEILTPWGINEPTGYVYKTTRWKINNIICPGSEDFPNLEETF